MMMVVGLGVKSVGAAGRRSYSGVVTHEVEGGARAAGGGRWRLLFGRLGWTSAFVRSVGLAEGWVAGRADWGLAWWRDGGGGGGRFRGSPDARGMFEC